MDTFPGKKLGDEIEYASGEGTYLEDEEIKASLCGNAVIDKDKRAISVKAVFKPPVKIRVGQELYGLVDSVGETSANIIIGYELKDGSRLDTSNDYAMLRMEGVKSPGTFIKTMKDVIRAGDLVRVEVLKITKGAIDVSMKKNELGVVNAFCSKCRSPLWLTKDNKLFCAKCERYETRKIGSPYLGRHME